MSSEEPKSASDPVQGHIPVLLHESVDMLNVRPGKLYVDATAGGGGHMRAILERTKDAQEAEPHLSVVGIDRDTNAIAGLKSLEEENHGRLNLIHSNYADLKRVLEEREISTVDGGILADLGVSSMQFDQGERGFSFMNDGPLDMRMDPTQRKNAADLINTCDEHELADIIYRYGEERYSRQIAREIVRQRPFQTTGQLADVVSRSLRYQHKKKHAGSKNRAGAASANYGLHPATRTFQAIRIAVNEELSSLEKFLEDAVSMLAPGARLAIITFHSLEDRVVKQFLRHSASSCVCPPGLPVCMCHHSPELLIITRKPVVAAEKEVLANTRSRSAKLRVAEKL